MTWLPILKPLWRMEIQDWWLLLWVTLLVLKDMTQIAREAGLGRESLYKALSSSGNPELATFIKVISALGLQLHDSPAVEAETAV